MTVQTALPHTGSSEHRRWPSVRLRGDRWRSACGLACAAQHAHQPDAYGRSVRLEP